MFGAAPLISTMLALGITLALIWLAGRLLGGKMPGGKAMAAGLRRAAAPRLGWLGMPSGPPALTLESVTPLALRRQVIVLRHGEHRLAVLIGGAQDLSLGWLPPASPPGSSPG